MSQFWRISIYVKCSFRRRFMRLHKKKQWRKNNPFLFIKKNRIFALSNNLV